MSKEQIYKIVATIVTAVLTCLAIAFGLSSCNVTRTITTQSQYYQRGDTTCTIVTKTIEAYDATKKLQSQDVKERRRQKCRLFFMHFHTYHTFTHNCTFSARARRTPKQPNVWIIARKRAATGGKQPSRGTGGAPLARNHLLHEHGGRDTGIAMTLIGKGSRRTKPPMSELHPSKQMQRQTKKQ